MTSEQEKEIARFPEPLRAFIAAELAAGNAIDHVGHSHPAPPAGAYVMLARPVSTRPHESAGPFRYRSRQSSTSSGEWTDEGAFFYILEPPGPPPEIPDMDAIRARANFGAGLPPPASKPEPVVREGFSVEFDYRGETLICHDGQRKAYVICTFNPDPRLVPRTLTSWWYPAERRSEPIGEAERRQLVERIVDYCRHRHGMSRMTLED